jgi:Tfp pilus assembly protein PilX
MKERIMQTQANLKRLQLGAITLPVALIILLLLSIVTIYGARVGMLETRTSANKIRAEEALAAAELGVETALAFVQRNQDLVARNTGAGWGLTTNALHWVQCSSTATTKPCNLISSAMRGRWMFLENSGNADLTSLLKVTSSCTDNDVNGICDSNTNQYSQVAGNYDYLYIMSRCRDLNNDGDCTDTNESATRPMEFPVITVFAEGLSADGTATAPVQQSAYFYDGSANLSDFPASIMAAGSVGSSGTFNVVVNPDAGGTIGNRPLAFWTKENVTFNSSSAATCYEGEVGVNGFLGSTTAADSTQTATTSDGKTVTLQLCRTCVCPNAIANGSISNNSTTHEIDILDVDSNTGKWLDAAFPSDVFKYVTSYATADYQSFKQNMISAGKMQEISDCGVLNTNSQNWYWFTGTECTISSDVGSLAHPVMLISQGNFKMNANNYFFGMIFAFSPNNSTLNVALNGGPTVYGILVSNTSISLSNGTYKARYVPNLFDIASENAPIRRFGRLPGGWKDY